MDHHIETEHFHSLVPTSANQWREHRHSLSVTVISFDPQIDQRKWKIKKSKIERAGGGYTQSKDGIYLMISDVTTFSWSNSAEVIQYRRSFSFSSDRRT